ncbi:MAG: BatA domain-containing protein [Gammaproteobacteria bacterium]|nr:BatA domain-containing protein [Gammaproteobacteria bacterium]
MSLGFLNPLFFAGITVLAVPVLIHLVAQRESRGKAFPSLMFVRRIPIKRTRRRTLRDPLLLGLRSLALTLLVVSFASPYWHNDNTPTVNTPTARQTVIALDRSYSMRFDGRWERALATARREIEDMPVSARAALVIFDNVPHTVAAMSGDKSHLRQALNRVNAGYGSTDYARVLAHAPQLFESHFTGDRNVLLISDLQLSGLQRNRTPRLAGPVKLEVENVARAAPSDLLLTHVQVLGNDVESARVNLMANIDIGQSDARSKERLSVRVDDHVAELRELSESEISAGSAALSVVPASDRVSRVEISLDRQDVAHSYRLTLAQVEPIKATLLTTEGTPHSAIYLQQALALASRPKIVVQMVASAALNDATLEHTDVVIIDDVALNDSGVIARIDRFVNAGGGLLTIAGDHPLVGALLLATSLMPGELGGELASAARLTELNPHPVLATLRSEQLRNAPVWRRRALRPGSEDVVLARYSDGAVALAERRLGSGTSILLSTAVSNRWSALALEPGFAPLAIALVRHLAKRRSGAGASAATVGVTVDLEQHAALLGTEALLNQLARGGVVLIESPDGAITKVSGSHPAFLPSEAGFYRLHTPGVAATPVPLAVNVDPRELQFETLSAAQFIGRVSRDAQIGTASSLEDAKRNTFTSTQWWYLLFVVTALLLIEGLYAVRLMRTGKATPKADPQAA